MPFTVKVDATKLVAATREFQSKQLPFVMAATLTAVAKDAQKAVQGHVRKAFTNRNTWTEQGIRIRPADKKGSDGIITADVHTDTANRSTGAPDYLGRQEEGGERVPVNGRHYIAVPTNYLRNMLLHGGKQTVTPAELRPRALLGAVGGRYSGRTRKRQTALRNQVRVRGFEFFLQKVKNGQVAIMGRYFTDRDAFPFYLLITQASVKKSSLRMKETVEATANARFEPQWDATWQRLFANGIKL